LKYIIISVFTLLTLLSLQSCQSKCSVGCSFQLDVASVGYAVDELDTVIITYYTPDNTFTTVTGSHLFDFSNPRSYLPYWQSVGIDTLACNGLILFNGGGTIPDFTILVQSNQRLYKFSDFVLSGSASENLPCN